MRYGGFSWDEQSNPAGRQLSATNVKVERARQEFHNMPEGKNFSYTFQKESFV